MLNYKAMLATALIILFCSVMVLISEKADAGELIDCPGYTLTDSHAGEGFFVAYDYEGQRHLWRPLVGQGYQVIDGATIKVIPPVLCIEGLPTVDQLEGDDREN